MAGTQAVTTDAGHWLKLPSDTGSNQYRRSKRATRGTLR
jgi:hypothetical protein